MPRIILIETSTSLCSTALVDGDSIVCSRRSEEPRAHAGKTAVFVNEMLEEAGWKVADCDAVAVSAGPGSYTGLRVGVSTAKGLCFGAGIPLISVGTLDTLVWQYLDSVDVNPAPPSGVPFVEHLPKSPAEQTDSRGGAAYIIPVIDARRMEVYTAVYSVDGQRLTDIAPIIVDANSFAEYRAKGPVVFIGDGAEKIAPVLKSDDTPDSKFINCCPEATAMLHPALAKYNAKEFEDVAYFEPFYLKQFVATVGKKLF